jgi:hypothetical protein
MVHRMLPAVSLVALMGCQPYYPPYTPAHGPVLSGGTGTASDTRQSYASFSPVRSTSSVYDAGGITPAVFTPTLSAKPPPAGPGGAFEEIDRHGGAVGFWNEDPVLRREVATYGDRYVERIDLKNGGAITYEVLQRGTFSDESDADLIREDLDLPPFRARGIMFEPAQLERLGPFTYLAQASAEYNCFIFRGKFYAEAGAPARSEAYGNVCYPHATKDLAAVKSEMLDLLKHARFGKGQGTTLVAAAAPVAASAPVAPVAPVAADPEASAPAASSAIVSPDRCPYSVNFSAPPAAESKRGGAAYTYAEGGYRETASCSCAHDLNYAKMSQFDAIDNVRREAEAQGFKLQKATFDKSSDLGKELAFEGVAGKHAGKEFLIGRSFYGECRFSVLATGTSYADLLKAQRFVGSVASKPAPAPSEATEGVYDVTVTNSAGNAAQDAAPPAVPVTPVDTAKVAAADKPAADADDADGDAADSEAAPPPPPAKPVPSADKSASASAAADTPAPATTKVAAATKPAADSAPAAVNTGSSVAPAAAADAGLDETVQRLRRLKLLFDQKLITPEEYEAKRAAILKTL